MYRARTGFLILLGAAVWFAGGCGPGVDELLLPTVSENGSSIAHVV